MATAPSFTTLKISTEGAVGRLTLDRPEKLNPLSWQCLAEIAAAARWFDTQPEVKTVVVTGADVAFAAVAIVIIAGCVWWSVTL